MIRVDFNVPLDNKFKVTDNTRIKAAMPTIQYILSSGGSCILISHLGRPKNIEAKYSLKHIVKEVEKVLGKEIIFFNDCIGEKAENISSNLRPGEVLLLENLRFYNQESQGDKDFSKKLFEFHAQVSFFNSCYRIRPLELVPGSCCTQLCSTPSETCWVVYAKEARTGFLATAKTFWLKPVRLIC